MTTQDKTAQDRTAQDRTALDGAVRWRAAGLACLVLLTVTGCAQQPSASAEVTPELSPSGAASPRPAVSESGPLSARDEQIAAGAEAIRAYRQMIFDIYADPRPNAQDMRKVATGTNLEQDLETITRNLGEGWKDTSGTVSVKWVKPVSIGKKEMRLYSCVDPNGIASSRAGKTAQQAKRYAADYVLTLSQEKWLVSAVYGHGDTAKARPC